MSRDEKSYEHEQDKRDEKRRELIKFIFKLNFLKNLFENKRVKSELREKKNVYE